MSDEEAVRRSWFSMRQKGIMKERQAREAFDLAIATIRAEANIFECFDINGEKITLKNVHPPEHCTGPCAMHNVSDHHMASWPIVWVSDVQVDWPDGPRGGNQLFRKCPHGNLHNDPDAVAFGGVSAFVENCACRCCQRPWSAKGLEAWLEE